MNKVINKFFVLMCLISIVGAVLICHYNIIISELEDECWHLQQIQTEKKIIPEKEKEIVTVVIEDKPEFTFSDEDMKLMAKIVHAEANDQDQIGKRLIVDVILNRVVGDDYPNTVHEVIYQSGQFTMPAFIYNESDMQAVYSECRERLDTQVTMFRADHFHGLGFPLYQHGDHYFSSIYDPDKEVLD